MIKSLYLAIEEENKSTLSQMLQVFIYMVIFINLISLSLDTVKTLHDKYSDIFSTIEIATVSIFILELTIRYIIVGQNQKFSGITGRIKYTLQIFTIIDILSIIPFFLTGLGINMTFLRILRFLRIFKLFRNKKSSSFERALKRVFILEKENIIAAYLAIFTLLVLLTIAVYFIENKAQPDVFSSIPETLWWAMVTLSTIGYGDMYPITISGRIITTIISMIGIAFYAIPGSLFTAALIEEMKNNKKGSH